MALIYPPQPIDPTTGRPIGNHGEAIDALTFALEHIEDDLDAMDFLRGWMEGDISSSYNFYPWLKQQER